MLKIKAICLTHSGRTLDGVLHAVPLNVLGDVAMNVEGSPLQNLVGGEPSAPEPLSGEWTLDTYDMSCGSANNDHCSTNWRITFLDD